MLSFSYSRGKFKRLREKNSTAISYKSSPPPSLSSPICYHRPFSFISFPQSRAFRLVFANECVSSIISSISSRQSSRPYLFVSEKSSWIKRRTLIISRLAPSPRRANRNAGIERPRHRKEREPRPEPTAPPLSPLPAPMTIRKKNGTDKTRRKAKRDTRQTDRHEPSIMATSKTQRQKKRKAPVPPNDEKP